MIIVLYSINSVNDILCAPSKTNHNHIICTLVSSPPPLELFHHLSQSLESEIMDGFWSSKYLKDSLRVLNKIGSFANSTNRCLNVKIRTKLT